MSVALLFIGFDIDYPQEFDMSKRTIVKIDREIAQSKETLAAEWKRLFKRIAILLMIAGFVGLLLHLILPGCHFTDSNTVTVVENCISVKRMEIGSGAKAMDWIQLELDNGKTYEIGSDRIKLSESELIETFQGKELTIRTKSAGSYRILALSDSAQVYHSLEDTNEINRFNRTVLFGILLGITALILLALIGFGIPIDEIRFLRYRRQERAELDAQTNSPKGGTT